MGRVCQLPAKPAGAISEYPYAICRAATYQTWFELAPKAVNIIVKSEKMGPEPMIKALWVVTVVASAIILAVALL